jgi:hypothetical protein
MAAYARWFDAGDIRKRDLIEFRGGRTLARPRCEGSRCEARKLIETCGYGRRLGELEELRRLSCFRLRGRNGPTPPFYAASRPPL